MLTNWLRRLFIMVVTSKIAIHKWRKRLFLVRCEKPWIRKEVKVIRTHPWKHWDKMKNRKTHLQWKEWLQKSKEKRKMERRRNKLIFIKHIWFRLCNLCNIWNKYNSQHRKNLIKEVWFYHLLYTKRP